MNLQLSLQRATGDLLGQPNLRLRIGEHIVDVGALRVPTRPDHPRLTSKAVAVLIELVREAGRTVTRDQLLDRVWAGRCPTPDVLTQAIRELRRAFVDDAKPPRYIETIPKVGYRLLAPVLVLDGSDGGLFVERAPGGAAGAPDAVTQEPQRAPRRRRWALAFGALALVLVVALSGSLLQRRGSGATRWRVSDMHALTSDPGPELRPHLSPDGTRVAFSRWGPHDELAHVVVRSLQPSQLVDLTAGTRRNEAAPVWSPDGTRIAFERVGRGDCAIFVASSLGGGEREVGACRDSLVSYYDWTPDGRGLITAERRGGAQGDLVLVRWDIDSGAKRFLDYPRAPGDLDLEPRYSPDGRWLAFRRGAAPHSDLFVMPSAGGAVHRVTDVASRIRGYTWSSDSRALILSTNHGGAFALYAAAIDGGPLQALGVSPAMYPDASRSGDMVVYQIPRSHDQLQLVPLGAGAAPPHLLAPSTASDFSAELSPDAGRVVFVSDRSGQLRLWLQDRATGAATPLGEEAAADVAMFSPRWSRDGARVIAVEQGGASSRLVEIDLATHRRRTLSAAGENVLFAVYGADADTYLVATGTVGHDNRLVLLAHPASSRETRRVLATGVAFAQLDAANRRLYYTTTDARGLFERSLDDGAPRAVSVDVTSIMMDGWRVVDGKIWYVSAMETWPTSLREIDPATGATRQVAAFDFELQDVNFSVTPARDAVLVAPVGADDTDIGAFRLDRADAR